MAKMSKTEQREGFGDIVKAAKEEDVKGGKRGMLQAVRGGALLSVQDWPDHRLTALIRFLGVEKATIPDYVAFFALAQRHKLDPFAGQIFLMMTNKGPKVAVERDGLLKVAQDHPDYLGYLSGAIHEEDDFEIKRTAARGPDGVEVNHTYHLERGELLGGYCVAFRKDWPPQVIVRMLTQYRHMMGKDNWAQNAADMIDTRCIAASHRRLFQLHGLYTREEMGDVDVDMLVGMPAGAGTAKNLEDLKDRVANAGDGKTEDVQEADFEVVEEGGKAPEGAEGADTEEADIRKEDEKAATEGK